MGVPGSAVLQCRHSTGNIHLKCVFVCVGMLWWTLAWLREQRTHRLSCWRWCGRGQHKKVEGPRGNKTPHSGIKHSPDSIPKAQQTPQPPPHYLCPQGNPRPCHLPPPLLQIPLPHLPLPLGEHLLKKHVLSPPPSPPPHLAQSTQRCTFTGFFSGVSLFSKGIIVLYVCMIQINWVLGWGISWMEVSAFVCDPFLHWCVCFCWTLAAVFFPSRIWQGWAKCHGRFLGRRTSTAAFQLPPPPNRLPLWQR